MAITDMAHPAFACHNIEDTLAFYEKLGITESFRLMHDDGSLMLVYLHVAGDRFIELFPNGPSREERAARESFMHICLTVDGIEAFVEDIRARGITIDVEPKMGLDHNMQAWIADPDGNKIELMEISPRSPQVAIRDNSAFPASEILIKKEG